MTTGRRALAGRSGRWRPLLALLLLLLGHAPAAAAVEIAFYSRDAGGSRFPHAFIRLSGTLETSGRPVDTTFGFTARAITPAILLGSVSGQIIVEAPSQVARSDRQFVLTLTDAQYGAVLGVVEQWRNRRQPSYNLNRRNCVHFVADLARAVGLRVENTDGLMKRPRAFLEHVRSLNPQLAATR